MESLNALSAYRAHDLNISMKTSSGDVISLDFANEQSLDMKQQNSNNASSSSLKFSSMQSFEFNIESNGLDEQDKKEIAAFMELAQPKIDSFIEELASQNQTSSVSKVAKDITSMLSNIDEKNADFKNYAKNSVVSMFDNAFDKQQNAPQLNKPEQNQDNINAEHNTPAQNNVLDFDKLFEESQKLLEKILQELETPNKTIYA